MSRGPGAFSLPTSAAIKTRCTPGNARALAVSRSRMRALACVLRSPAAWRTPGGLTSSTKQPAPASSRGSSLRGIRAPISRVLMKRVGTGSLGDYGRSGCEQALLLHGDIRREQADVLSNSPELAFDGLRGNAGRRVGNVQDPGSFRGNRRARVLPVDDRAGN